MQKIPPFDNTSIHISIREDKRQAYVDSIMADTEINKPSNWAPCSNEERQRIECQTRIETQAQFGYWSLYRDASSVEIAGMVLCTISAIGAGVVTPLMTVALPALPD
jgi:hypothetical protein